MTEQATERITIDAPPERCYEVATDFEQYPSWAKDVKEVTVLATDDGGRATEVEFRAAAIGRSVTYVLRYDYADAPHSFSWELVRGDIMKRLDGTYAFDADGGGTRVSYELAVDLALPLPGVVKRRAQGRIMSNALRSLKQAAEQS